MHQVYFVYLPKGEKIKTSKEARRRANDELDANNFANESNGYFGMSKADWFMIGGRWSGLLTEILGRERIPDKKHIKAEIAKYHTWRKEKNGEWSPKKMNDEEFKKKIAEYTADICRNQYHVGGYEDDAMILNKRLLAALTNIKTKVRGFKRNELRKCEVFDPVNFDEFIVADLNKNELGGWLVVVDYHY